MTALLARFHDGARPVFVVDGEGRLAGMVRPGELLVGLELGVVDQAAAEEGALRRSRGWLNAWARTLPTLRCAANSSLRLSLSSTP